MTTAVIDPGVTIAEAIRELVDSVRELVEPDTDDPGVLDELSRLVGRARRRINKAKKAGEPARTEPKPSVPAPTPATPAAQAPASASPTTPAPAPAPTVPAAMSPMMVEPTRPASPARPAAITPAPRVTLTIPHREHRPERVPANHRAPRAAAWYRRPAVIVGSLAVLLVLGLVVAVVALWSSETSIEPAETPVGYCVQVGDDNCDGMIVPSESGWRCVPPSGGPLVC